MLGARISSISSVRLAKCGLSDARGKTTKQSGVGQNSHQGGKMRNQKMGGKAFPQSLLAKCGLSVARGKTTKQNQKQQQRMARTAYVGVVENWRWPEQPSGWKKAKNIGKV